MQNQRLNFGSTVLLRYSELEVVVGTKITAVNSTIACFNLFLVSQRLWFLFFGKPPEFVFETELFHSAIYDGERENPEKSNKYLQYVHAAPLCHTKYYKVVRVQF